MRFLTIIMLFIASATLCSCAHHTKEYLKKGGEINSLVVPPGVPALRQDPYYPIPESPTTSASSSQSVSLMPPTLQKK